MNSSQSPSILRVIQNDYVATLGAIFPPITWVVFGFMLMMEGGNFSKLFPVGLAITVLGFAAILWRYQLIRAVFEYGQETPAVISGIAFFRDRGRVHYVYTFQGQKYTSSNAIMKNGRTRKLQVGDPVTLVVSRDQPKRAFIRDLYL
jgi:hypothetical protein